MKLKTISFMRYDKDEIEEIFSIKEDVYRFTSIDMKRHITKGR